MQKEAMVPLRLGRYPQALRRLTQALRDADGRRGRRRRGATSAAPRLVRDGAAVPAASAHGDRVVREAQSPQRRESSRRADALAHAYFILDWAYAALGRLDEAVYSERAIEIYEELGDLDRLAWVLNNLGGLTYLRGRWDEALELAERARATFKRIGDESQASIAALNIAEVRSDQGRDGGGGAGLPRGPRRAARPPETRSRSPRRWALLGRHLARDGEHEEAVAVLEEARKLFEAEGDEEDLLTTDAWLSECHVLEGNGTRRWSSPPKASGARRRPVRRLGRRHASPPDLRLGLPAGGRPRRAGASLAESLRIARIDDENFGIMSAELEAARSRGARPFTRSHRPAHERARGGARRNPAEARGPEAPRAAARTLDRRAGTARQPSLSDSSSKGNGTLPKKWQGGTRCRCSSP